MKTIKFLLIFIVIIFSAELCKGQSAIKLIENYKLKYDSLAEIGNYNEGAKIAEKALKIIEPNDFANLSTFQLYKANTLETTSATNDQCEAAYDIALEYSRKAINNENIIKSLGHLLDFNYDQSTAKKAKREKIGLELNQMLNTSTNELEKAQIFAYLVLYNKANRNDKEALTTSLHSLEIYKNLYLKADANVSSDDLALAYYQVSRAYKFMYQSDKQSEYLQQMRKYIVKNDDLLASYYNFEAQNLFHDKKIKPAELFNDSLRIICEKQENTINWNNLLELNLYFAQGFAKWNDYPNAKKYVEKANTIYAKYGQETYEGNINYTNGTILFLGKKYDKAAIKFKKAAILSQKFGFGDLYQMSLAKAALSLEKTGLYKEAYQYSKKAAEVADSLAAKSTEAIFTETEAKFQNKEKQQQIEIKNLQISKAKQQQIWYISGLSLLALALSLLFRTFQIKKKSAQVVAEKNVVLEKLNADLNEANQTKAKLFGIISHDLRSPISQVYQFLRLHQLNPNLLSNEQKTDLTTKIQTATGSLLETMEDLLLWSKTQMSQFNVKKESSLISAVIEQCLQLLKLNIESKNLTISNEIDEKLKIETDPYFLQIIVRNLLQNAIKASPQNGEIKMESIGNSFVIQNEGELFTQNQFETAIKSNQKQETLSGLGLKLVDELSHKIGAKISFEQIDFKTSVKITF
jgi:signal transduction histidine kinase